MMAIHQGLNRQTTLRWVQIQICHGSFDGCYSSLLLLFHHGRAGAPSAVGTGYVTILTIVIVMIVSILLVVVVVVVVELNWNTIAIYCMVLG
jgi:hypothetical protein